MRSIEQSGKTVEDATREALSVLGVSESEVEIEVLEEGGRGFLGLHPSEARVRVTLRDAEGGPAPAGDAGEVVRDVLAAIVQRMGLDARIEMERLEDGSYRLEVFGDDMGVVIGKHGNTINALQYLVGLIAHKRVGERVRVVVDAEGYRGRREQTLRDLARSYADRVKETGQEAVLDALQSYERRIIHTALAEDPDVVTYSEGEEPDRRVVISPRQPEA